MIFGKNKKRKRRRTIKNKNYSAVGQTTQGQEISEERQDWDAYNIGLSSDCDSCSQSQSYDASESFDPMATRNIPTTECKYIAVWKRVRARLSIRFACKKMHEDIRMYGSSFSFLSGDKDKGNVDELIQRSKTMSSKDFIQVSESVPFCMFHPHRTPAKVWNIVVMFLLIYTATVMPYKIAFIDVEPGSDWFYFGLVIDGLFFTDFCVNCFMAYYDDENHLITDRRKIICAYAKSWMIMDLVACFPFDFIDTGQDENQGSGGGGGSKLLRLVRLPRLYRLVRISRIFKMFKSKGNSENMERLQEFLNLKQSSQKILASVFTALLSLHLVSCFWYFSAKLDGFGPDTWVVRYDMANDSDSDLYMASFFWALTTLSTVGYGDIGAETQLEKLLCMAWMIFGVLFFSLTVGQLTEMLDSVAGQETILQNKILIIEGFCTDSKLSKDLRRRLKHAITYHTEKIGFSWSDKSHIFNELPRDLKYEVSVAMYNGAIQKFPYFMDKNSVFVSFVAIFLTPLFIKAHEILYYQNEHADEVYFILKGRMSYVYGDKRIAYKFLAESTYLGEIECLKQIPRLDTAMAPEDCDMFVMSKSILDEVCDEFPEVAKEMRDLADMREVQNLQARKQIENLMKAVPNEQVETVEEDTEQEVESSVEPPPAMPENEDLHARAKAISSAAARINKKQNKLKANLQKLQTLYKDRPLRQVPRNRNLLTRIRRHNTVTL